MNLRRRLCSTLVAAFTLVALTGCPTQNPGTGTEIGNGTTVFAKTMVVLGYNDLGMHCMNEDFSEFMILPPYNTLHATIIERREEPRIITQGVTVQYSIPSNTTSANKTNFWSYAPDLFDAVLPADVGLTGSKLAGNMTFDASLGRNDWVVTGIPLTPMNDKGVEDPYPLATISVTKNGVKQAQTQAVVPVSWEISCNICHTKPGMTVGTAILTSHDNLHGTDLVHQKPVACGSCHAQAPLGWTGVAGVPSLSQAMHGAHASRMAQANLDIACYACHPGFRTQCLRDVHYAKGMDCLDCHGDMTAVANPSRSPWVDEPRCGDCHQRRNFEFEQANTLFRDAKGHHGVQCSACHGSPHAITPTVTSQDNVQAIALQGHAGAINSCAVCHVSRPDDSFDHRYGGGEGEGGGDDKRGAA